MEKYINIPSLLIGGIGGLMTFLFGAFDSMLKVLIIFIIFDYITGLIKSINNKNMSSGVGFNGILKKFLIIIIVSLSHLIQSLLDCNVPLREMVITFFIANEGISILENASEFIPIPQKLKDILLQLRNNTEQKGGSVLLNYNQWVNKYIGKATDYDKVYGVQCVDLIDCYIVECLGLKKGFYGNAVDWWNKRNDSAWLKNNFDFITPTYKNGELKRGDIGIRTSGKYGHIFIIDCPTSSNKMTYYDQNAYGIGDKMTKRKTPYTKTYINGILRPKNQKQIAIPPTIKNGTYTLTNVRGVYNGAGSVTKRKKVSDLTTDGKKNATSKKSTDEAYLKAGTKITISETKLISSGNLWAKIPSGWLCVWECEKDKKYIK